MKWIVERRPNSFDTVEAYDVKVSYGALVFVSNWGAIELAFAPGQWITVCPDEDANE